MKKVYSLWRIGTDAPSYTANDLTGKGAEITGGRWNSKGRPVVYSATSIALAAMETVVHLQAGGLPLNRYLVRLDVPVDVWKQRTKHTAGSIPVGWDAIPEGAVSLAHGDSWLQGTSSALMEVPSVIVPEELNVLINPNHPDVLKGLIVATKIRKWVYDTRLFK